MANILTYMLVQLHNTCPGIVHQNRASKEKSAPFEAAPSVHTEEGAESNKVRQRLRRSGVGGQEVEYEVKADGDVNKQSDIAVLEIPVDSR